MRCPPACRNCKASGCSKVVLPEPLGPAKSTCRASSAGIRRNGTPPTVPSEEPVRDDVGWPGKERILFQATDDGLHALHEHSLEPFGERARGVPDLERQDAQFRVDLVQAVPVGKLQAALVRGFWCCCAHVFVPPMLVNQSITRSQNRLLRQALHTGRAWSFTQHCRPIVVWQSTQYAIPGLANGPRPHSRQTRVASGVKRRPSIPRSNPTVVWNPRSPVVGLRRMSSCLTGDDVVVPVTASLIAAIVCSWFSKRIRPGSGVIGVMVVLELDRGDPLATG